MPRPRTNLDHLKRSISVKALAESYGVKLKRHGGADFIGHCPLADHAGGDRTASFVVSPKKNLWNCLGACQRGGSVIDLVMAMDSLSFVAAVKKLESKLDSTPPAASAPPASEPAERDVDDVRLLWEVAEHYHARLKETPRALTYLEHRGIASAAAIEQFRLGFVDQTFLEALPSKSTDEGRELRQRLMRLGVMTKRGHEAFGGAITIPVFGERGEVLDLYGRAAHAGTEQKHRYLIGPHRGVFNAEALRGSDEVILCEALIDALTFWCAGFVNVTASYGTSGFGPQHLEAMKRYGTKRVLIAYDRDAAGDAAAEKLAKKLGAELGIACWRVEFMKGHDANSHAKLLRPADKSLALVLSRARWMGDGAEPERPRTGLISLFPPPNASVAPPPASAPPPSVELDLPPAVELAVSSPPPASLSELQQANDVAEAPPPLAAPNASRLADASPPLSGAQIAAEVAEDEVRLAFGDRRYRVRGFARNTSVDVLKVNLLVSRRDAFYVDTLDLYAARFRQSYIVAAAKEVDVAEDVLKADLGRVLLKLEAIQEARLKALSEPKVKPVTLSPAEETAALELLRDPKLVERILADYERCGVVGEKVNKLTGYLAAVSRKLDDPLAIIIQSSSAAGKTSLMEAVLAFMPEEERVKYSAMTGQSLFYMGETNLKHKILAIVEEEGAERAAYALKLLQSEKELSIASTGKDPATGELRTKEYRIEGPVMIFLTTTAVEIDEELLNRCILLTVDEDRAQTRAIHRLQRRRETLEGALEHHDRQKILKLHQNAQRLLRPLRVANPHAERLSFGDHQLRMRRDHMKYLCLIRSIALLHQYQRTLKQIHRDDEVLDFIEVERSDIALANHIARHVLARSLDELPPQTRRVLEALDAMVLDLETGQGLPRCDVRFTRRDVLAYTGLGYTQLRVHLERLIELEHLLVHWGRRGQSFAYELVYDPRDFGTESLDLVDLEPSSLESLLGSPPEFAGVRRKFAGPSRVHRGPIAGPSRGAQSEAIAKHGAGLSASQDNLRRKSTLGLVEVTPANGHAEPLNGHGRRAGPEPHS